MGETIAGKLHARQFQPTQNLAAARTGGAADPEGLKALSPHLNLKQVKAVVFDIDGTLYSLASGPFVKRYMELVKNHLPAERYPAFVAEWGRALAGRSPFRSGRVFDVSGGRVLVLDKSGKVAEAYEKWGGRVPPHEVRKNYPNPIANKQEGYVFMEGGAWALTGLARSFGIGYDENEGIYQQIYDEIAKEPHKFFAAPDKALSKFFTDLKNHGIKIAVMSNTPDPMASIILETMGVKDKVGIFVPAARKPVNSEANLKEIMTKFGVKPGEVLSVGDSVGNDLDVPRSLGMQTVLLEDFPVENQKSADAKGKSIGSLDRAFNDMWQDKEDQDANAA